jgi:hypothetical protein
MRNRRAHEETWQPLRGKGRPETLLRRVVSSRVVYDLATA